VLPAILVFCRGVRERLLWSVGIALVLAGVFIERYKLLPISVSVSDFRVGWLFVPAALALSLRHQRFAAAAKRLLQPIIVLPLMLLAIAQPHLATSRLTTAFLMPAAVASTVLNSRGIFAKLLESAPLRWIGKRSYSLYLWQQLFLVGHFLEKPELRVQLPFVNWIAAFVLAALSYRWVEQPMIRAGRRVIERMHAPIPDRIPAPSESTVGG
jgi:peptidoglycan/LPS O-acetylase OafA/YrhL